LNGVITRTRPTFRVTILWSDVSVADAAGAISSGNSFRLSFWGCYMTDHPYDFTDDVLKNTVTFKCPPFNKAGSGMIKAEEAEDAILATLGAYDGSAP
jgi:hypothetical protein